MVADLGHAVPNLVLDNEHPKFFQLFPQLFDVKGHNVVFNVDIGTVVKDIQETVHIQVKDHRDMLRHKRRMKFGQERQISPVNYGLFDGFQPVLAARDKLTERQQKVGFQGGFSSSL